MMSEQLELVSSGLQLSAAPADVDGNSNTNHNNKTGGTAGGGKSGKSKAAKSTPSDGKNAKKKDSAKQSNNNIDESSEGSEDHTEADEHDDVDGDGDGHDPDLQGAAHRTPSKIQLRKEKLMRRASKGILKLKAWHQQHTHPRPANNSYTKWLMKGMKLKV